MNFDRDLRLAQGVKVIHTRSDAYVLVGAGSSCSRWLGDVNYDREARLAQYDYLSTPALMLLNWCEPAQRGKGQNALKD